MTTRELIATVERYGVRLSAEGERLRFHGRASAVPADVLSMLRDARPDVVRALREPVEHPLSHAQSALLFVYQADSAAAAYNVTFSARVRSIIDVAALEATLATVVERHPILRTTYAMRADRPVQIVNRSMAVDFARVDATDAPLDSVRGRALADSRVPFDLERGPLLRGRLYARAPDDGVLLVVAPHIALDGWSTWQLVDELRRIYPAILAGEADPLEPVSSRYVEYVAWQDEMLAGEQGARLADYWDRVLASPPPPLELPTDFARPANFRFAGALRSFTLDAALTARIRAFARAHGVTLYMLFLAVYQVLLHRYSGQERLWIGSPTTGRTRPEFSDVVGCFVNSVVLTADLSGDPSFLDCLAAARESTVGALTHQEYPLGLMARARERARTPLFRADFVLQRPQRSKDVVNILDDEGRPDASVDFGGLILEPFPVPQQAGQVDLTLELVEAGDEVVGDFKYHTDLFQAATIDRMIGHYRNLIESALTDPAASVSALALIDDDGRDHILELGRGPVVALPHETVVDRIDRWVATRPGQTAVVAPESDRRRALSYAELDAAAESVRVTVDRLSPASGGLVAYCMTPSHHSVAAVLGIWRSGRAVLPLDPAQPPGRMAGILAEADVALVIAEHATADLVAGEGRTVVLREDLRGCTERAPSRPSPDDPAYVIFTSGTTGRPKGVTITHASLLNALVGWEDAYDLEPADVHLQMAAPGFDVWMGDLVRAVATGGTLVVLPREWLLVPERMAEVVRAEGVTVAEFVPSVLRTLRDHLARTGDRLSHMRLIACGSDQWYVREIAGILEVIPEDCRLVNSYGLTEATIDSSFFDLATLTGDPDRQVPIGRPFANVRLHVLDARLRPVPIGVLGELCIGGAGVARGYLMRPDLDAERFVPDPFCADPGARLYRTGDVARMRADGVFELVGRNDDQVKIRGNRVELGDIEACLASHPSVAAAVATFERGADDSGGRLGAFVVPLPGERLDHAGLFERARALLPGYMVPGTIRTIECVPIGVNGKVDRKALPALGEDPRDEALDRTSPRTETERALLGIWRSLLEIEAPFGVHADFFQLGGHSLLATRLMWLVRDQLDAAVPPHAIFEDSTIARLAVRVDAARLAGETTGRSTADTETTEF